MNFHPGDQVVHWTYGLGEIIELDEKKLLGKTEQYYVVQINDLTLWVPVTSEGESSLRFPTPAGEFDQYIRQLNAAPEPLEEDRLQRKNQLSSLLKDGSLASVCKVVRDLANHVLTKKGNEHDFATLERALNLLLEEWSASLSIPLPEARQELAGLMGEEIFHAKPSAR